MNIKDELGLMLSRYTEEEQLLAIASVLEEKGLQTASNLVISKYEPCLTKEKFTESLSSLDDFDGVLNIGELVSSVEKIVNCDTTEKSIAEKLEISYDNCLQVAGNSNLNMVLSQFSFR